MASLEEEMSLIKDMSTQVAQLFLDTPVTSSQTPITSMAPVISDPALVTTNQTEEADSKPITTCNQINSLDDN